MPIGDTITDPIPAVGTAGTLYATELVAFLTEVKARLEADVPMSSLLVGVLDMSNNHIANVDYLGLYAKTAVPSTPVGSLQRYQNNLYYVSNSGAVRLTNGAALDATSVGGITGDYGGTNPAQLRFVDADKAYYHYDDYAGLAWAYMAGRGVDIYGGLTSTTRVRITWAGSANPSYTLTLPATVPVAAAALQMATDGTVTASSTFTGDLTASKFLFTSQRILSIPVGAMDGSGPGVGIDATTQAIRLLTSSGAVYIPITLSSGDTFTSYTVYIKKTSATGTITAQLNKVSLTAGTVTAVGSAATNGANNPGYVTLAPATPFTAAVMDGSTAYNISVTGGGTTGDLILGAAVAYSRPV